MSLEREVGASSFRYAYKYQIVVKPISAVHREQTVEVNVYAFYGTFPGAELPSISALDLNSDSGETLEFTKNRCDTTTTIIPLSC